MLSGRSPRFYAVTLACAFFIAAGAFLYPSAKSYYIAMRDYERVQAEYATASQRNADLQESVALLSSAEGMEDRARAQYGWVRSGDNAVLVSGLSDDDGIGKVRISSKEHAKAPTTWYSPFLDAVFGYTG